MPSPNLCAYDAAGRVLVIADGRQVLVHGGADEAPLWKCDLAADPVGFAAAGDLVVTLDDAGKLSFWNMMSGELLGAIDVPGPPRALVSARNRPLFAAVGSDGITLVERNTPSRALPLTDATAAALTDDGARVAIGDAAGTVHILSASGEAVGTSKLDGAVTSLCFSAKGFWIATSGDRVLRVPFDGGEPEHITRAGDMAPDCASASTDGSLFAVRLSPTLVMALAYPSRETAVQLRYFDRQAAGVAFGKGHRLGVALAGGDGNFVDIPNEALLRTDTFPGRTHNRWMVGTVIKSQGGAPEAPRPAPAPIAPTATSDGSGSARTWLIVIAALIVLGVILSRVM
ncbi:Hypothetical protein A7982_10185 [Minicystis rosea]|nr:Hypothetical protein A7982_10185 [Minicystis rosea]